MRASSPLPLGLNLNATSSKKPPLITPPKAGLCYSLFQPLLYFSVLFYHLHQNVRSMRPGIIYIYMHRAYNTTRYAVSDQETLVERTKKAVTAYELSGSL